jgi:hypothetical protein
MSLRKGICDNYRQCGNVMWSSRWSWTIVDAELGLDMHGGCWCFLCRCDPRVCTNESRLYEECWNDEEEPTLGNVGHRSSVSRWIFSPDPNWVSYKKLKSIITRPLPLFAVVTFNIIKASPSLYSLIDFQYNVHQLSFHSALNHNIPHPRFPNFQPRMRLRSRLQNTHRQNNTIPSSGLYFCISIQCRWIIYI